jgi:hypothetical protein
LAGVTQEVICQCFGHLGTTGIVGAEEKDTIFHAADYIRFSGYIKLKRLAVTTDQKQP